MPVKITRLLFRSLWNSEYTIFVNQIIEIFKKYNPASLHLLKSFGRLEAMSPKLAKIQAHELSNSISRQLHELDSERDTLIKAVMAQVKAMSKLSLPAIAPHVVVLNHFFDIHGRDIANANYNAETKRISDLLNDYNAKADVKKAVDGLHLTILFDQLGVVNTNFADLFMQRTEEDAAVEKVDTPVIRAETDKVLVAFFEAVEFCSSEYEELDYKTPANELNDLISYYKTQLKARNTRRNSGKDISTEMPIEIPE